MSVDRPKVIPIQPADDVDPDFRSPCEEKEPFALMVLGDIMEPEFEDGSIIVCDPGHPLFSGAYVVVHYADDYWFRQYLEENGKKYLKPLNPAHPDIELVGPFEVRGVVWQKNYKRKITKYL